jgi:hypothetical protein
MPAQHTQPITVAMIIGDDHVVSPDAGRHPKHGDDGVDPLEPQFRDQPTLVSPNEDRFGAWRSMQSSPKKLAKFQERRLDVGCDEERLCQYGTDTHGSGPGRCQRSTTRIAKIPIATSALAATGLCETRRSCRFNLVEEIPHDDPHPCSQQKPRPPDLQVCDLYKSRRPVELLFRNLLYRDLGGWCRHSRRRWGQRLITQKNDAIAILKRQRANRLPTVD